MSRHIVISGTGRAGTTLLFQLLTELDLKDIRNDPFKSNHGKYYPEARAGLEYDLRKPNAPYLVKDPRFFEYAGEIYQRPDVRIECLIIPIRDLATAADSRRQNQRRAINALPLWRRFKDFLTGREHIVPGGLVGTGSLYIGDQERVLLSRLYKLLLATADHHVPIILLHFPRFASDSKYAFDKLAPILEDTTFEAFDRVLDSLVDQSLINPH